MFAELTQRRRCASTAATPVEINPHVLWYLNANLRLFDTGDGRCLVELDDRFGRTARMSIAADMVDVLRRFDAGCTWARCRSMLREGGATAPRIVSIGTFLSGPCREKRLLLSHPRGAPAADEPVRPHYVSASLELISPEIVNPIASALQVLMSVPARFVAAAIVGAGFLTLYEAIAHARAPTLSSGDALWVGALSVLGVLLHELGHATAAYRLGARRVGIGVGWYLVIPVAYSDLSEIWRYRRRDRVIVDVAGVYMQALFMCVLIVLHRAQGSPIWLVAACATTTSMLWNLNPFLRLDGYWIVADALGVADLRREAAVFVARAVRRRTIRWSLGQFALASYAVGSCIFLAWMFVKAVMFVAATMVSSLRELPPYLASFAWSTTTPSQGLLGAVVALWHAALFYMTFRYLTSIAGRLRRWWRDGATPS